MSNIVTLDFSAVPDFAKGKSAIATALSGSLAGGVRRLSIKGGVFRYVVGGQEIGKIPERFLDVVLVNAAPHITRTYYPGVWDPKAKAAPPACWSADGKLPAPTVKAPQHANCADCPQNMKGSGTGDARACKFSQRLALVLANDIEGEVLQLSVPATSLFGDEKKEAGVTLQGYIKSLAARSIDPAALTTRITFDTEKESPTVLFSAVGWLNQGQYDAAVLQGKSEKAIQAITMSVSEADGVDAADAVPLPSGAPPVMKTAEPAAVVKPPAKTAAKAEPKVKVEAGVEMPETPAEPVVRKGPETPTAAARPDLAALIEEFATDD